MALDYSTTFAPVMKEIYTPNKVTELVLKDRPLLAIVDKQSDFFGSDVKQPALIGNASNYSADFATGLAGTSTSTYKAFIVTRAKYYAFVSITNETLEASANDKGAFKSGLKSEIDSGMNGISNSLARQMYRSGWGDIGQIGTITGTTITLSVAAQAFNFEVNQSLQFAAALGTGATRSATAVTVTAVNRSAGTIVISATTGSPANGDFIFVAGDRDNGTTPVKRCLTGLEAWVPFGGVTAGSGDSFFGVDRGVDSRLYGNSLDASSMNLEEALLGGIELSTANSGSPDYVMINPVQYLALVKTLTGRVQYTNLDVPNTKIGFRGILVQGPKGDVTVMSDINCPADRGWVIQSEDMLWHTLNDAPELFEADGLPYLRDNGADSVNVRIKSYSQLRILAPSHFTCIKLALP